jgi:hypothetical protein
MRLASSEKGGTTFTAHFPRNHHVQGMVAWKSTGFS